MPQGRKRRADDGEKRMKKECTEQDLQRFVQDAKLAFEDVTLTELDEDRSRYWQDDGLMVDYELRNGQVGCVLRRQIFVEGKVWELQMTAPLAGSGLPLILLPEQLRQQRASGVALCAMDRMLAGDPGDVAALTPNYLRMAQAERTRQNNQDFYLKK